MHTLSDNFSKNILLLIHFMRQTQASFARSLMTSPTTVNKWVLEGAVPRQDDLEVLTEHLQVLLRSHVERRAYPQWRSDFKLLDASLIISDPYVLGDYLKLPRYKVHSVINKKTIPLEHLVFQKLDRLLQRLVGAYALFSPSPTHSGAYVVAALKIMNDEEDGLFYFEQMSQILPSSRRSNQRRGVNRIVYGSVGRMGEGARANAIFIGDIVDVQADQSTEFIFCKIPSTPNPILLTAQIVDLDVDPKSSTYGYMIPAPAAAITLPGVDHDTPLDEFLPRKAYYNQREMAEQYPHVLEAIRDTPRRGEY